MRFKLIFLPALLLSAQAISANIEEVKADDIISRDITAGDRTFSLPPGQWHVIARSKSNGADVAGNPFPIRNVLLAQYKHNELFAMVRVISPLGDLSKFGRNGWKDDPCSNLKSVYMQDKLEGNYRLPECVYVRPVFGFGDAADSYWREAMRRIRSAGVSTPPLMVIVDCHYYRDGGFVHFSTWLNPEMAGVARDPALTAIDSKWNSENIQGPYKNFADQAGSWAYRMAAAVKSSYNGNPLPVPELPYVTIR
ncbi:MULTISPECIES: hypothetical protein [Aquitalea]|uniref:hypothetical protein n=1 Tax=Aquitalea TaxID=407217 RepID=UPI000F5B2B7D|nr:MULTISPECIES: hypothetical protein [Aquitalea]